MVNTSFSRYKKWLIVWIITIISFSLMIVLNSQLQGTFNIYKILTQNLWTDVALLFLSIPFVCIIAFIVGGYILTPLFLVVHKKIIGRHLTYGIKDRNRPKDFKGVFLMSLFPAFLALNIGTLLIDEPFIHDLIFVEVFITGMSLPILQILTLIMLFPLVSGIGIAVFSAAIFLLDSGIEYSNKEQKKVRRGSFPIEVRSVGGYFLYYLKGYAGIAVIISVFSLVITFITTLQGLESVYYLMNLVTWPFIPFLIASFMVPTFIIQDITYERRKRYTLKWAEKLGINGPLENPLGEN